MVNKCDMPLISKNIDCAKDNRFPSFGLPYYKGKAILMDKSNDSISFKLGKGVYEFLLKDVDTSDLIIGKEYEIELGNKDTEVK